MSRTRQLTGAQRVAAFLLGLDKDAAAKIIAHLDEKIVVEVVEAMSLPDLAALDPARLRDLDRELVQALRKPVHARIRSSEELRAVLEQTLGKQQATSLYDKIQQRLLRERPFLAIERAPAANVARALAAESDAVAALVLAHLSAGFSADVLAAMAPERAPAVVKRMASLETPAFDVLVSIAGELAERVAEIACERVAPPPVVQLRTIAAVLNSAPAEVERTLLDTLGKDDAQMAAEIRELMFTWEDLADLDRRAMQKVLSSVDARTLAVALKGSSEPVELNVMGNLSVRVREMIKEERELAGAMPMREVVAARNEMLRAVRSLLDDGEFSLTREGDELVT